MGGAMGSLALIEADAVKNIFDFEGDIDVLDDEVSGGLELDRGKIEDSLDAGRHHLIEHLSGGVFGDGEDGHQDIVFLYKGREVAHR